MPVFAEVETRRELREGFGTNQRLASERVAQSSGAIFFNVEIMLQGPEYPKYRLRENVETFAAEHFFKATNRLAYFDGQEWRHPDGESYNDFFDRAIDYYQDSPKLVERFQAEKEGYIRAGILVNTQQAMGHQNPEIGIASPPGDIYRNQSFAARNVTFIAMPICERAMKLGNIDERVYQEYQMIVIPSTEIATNEHWQTIIDAGDLQSSLTALRMLSNMVEPNNPTFVVSMPVLLENIEELVTKLGYKNIEELISETERMLDLENDPLAPERRRDMIDYFTDEIWWYISRRNQLSAQDELRLQGLADVMHDYLSLEGGAQYRGQTFDQVKLLIEGHTKVHQRNIGVHFTGQEYTDWDYGEFAYQMYFNQLRTNPRAQESRSNGGCPVSVNQPLFESRFGGIETYSADTTGFIGDQMNFDTSTYSSSTGKYTEFYDYRKGVCKHCGNEKPYVAHPKSSDIKCAGWCSDCET